ncbi:uncharacterized protein LOC111892970 [Lactuca sativa]|uniref:uncharacterized protein LOC111892970 n=1 Tax=Lactuca sativa TaxID=4236 RepID=UPI000CD93F7F|nr:uncharacterized protein LOC111892970 [Lactuca sativa]
MVISNDFKKMLKVRNAVECKDIVLNENFWRNCLITVKVMTHLLRLLRLCDSYEKPTLGYVYEGMYRAIRGVKELFKKKKELYKPYTDIIDRRWDIMLRKNIHSATYWLNPVFQYNHENVFSKRKVFQGVLDMVEKNFSGTSILDLTLSLGKFRDSEDEWWKLDVDKRSYDPIDYECIDKTDFWMVEKESKGELDYNDLENMLHEEEHEPAAQTQEKETIPVFNNEEVDSEFHLLSDCEIDAYNTPMSQDP